MSRGRPRPGPAAVGAPVLTATGLAAVLALAYLALAPPSVDLAAALYRADLTAHHGLVLWDGQWYGGHYALGYSVLFGPLAAALGAREVGALSAVAAAALFALIVRRHFVGAAGTRAGTGARAGASAAALWFGAGVSVTLLTGRMPFELGAALGLGAVALAQRGRRALAAPVAALGALASPVAGAFLVLAGGGALLGGTAARSRVAGASAAAGALLALLALDLAFPEGGREPFVASSFWPALVLIVGIVALLPREQRALRAGGALYALGCVAAFAVPNALGGNAVRLGALCAGPLVAGALWPRRRRLLALAAVPLLYWQLVAPVRDVLELAGDPAVAPGYYRPLLDFLTTRSGGPFRIEIPFTHSHWEAYRAGRVVPLARGWERQLDIARNGLFYRPGLSAQAYRAWLVGAGVRYIALADAPLDGSARAEAGLIERGLDYLAPVFHSRHWRVYEVRSGPPLAAGPGTMSELGVDHFTLTVRGPGSFLVRERYTPYWTVLAGNGCVGPAPGGLTAVRGDRAGELRVGIDFSPARVGDTRPRCSPPATSAASGRR